VIVVFRFDPRTGYRSGHQLTNGVLPGWIPNQSDAIAGLQAHGWYDCAAHGERYLLLDLGKLGLANG
jgi:hypothetical protein